MVERYQAPNNGQNWEASQKKYDACPRKEIMKRRVWENLFGKNGLSDVLYGLYPPGYDDALKILVESEDQDCWLSGLDSTPKPETQAGYKDVFPSWRCTIDGEPTKTGPIHLRSAPSRRIRQRLVVDGPWKPPKYFPNFSQFKRLEWDRFRANNPSADNGPTYFFADFRRDGNVYEIRAKSGEYADYVATIKCLNHPVRLAGGNEKNAAELLGMGWNAKASLLPLPVASPIAQDIMVVTKDDKVLVCYDRRCEQWNVSASAIPQKAKDAHGDDPTTVLQGAIRRRTYEELGLHIDPIHISWMAFGIGRRIGHTAFIGQIKLSKTEQQIRDCFENRSDKEGVREIKFIPLEIADVQKFLKTRECRYFLWLSLHLCLWRKFPRRVKIFP
ncbi:MAG TPA: hypothetical protein VG938_00460 [Verrucomicrobiae bacterium]|jgi:hypothetical protein|nr:hypothetical protein [Verrucomicrobiae bacterium]